MTRHFEMELPFEPGSPPRTGSRSTRSGTSTDPRRKPSDPALFATASRSPSSASAPRRSATCFARRPTKRPGMPSTRRGTAECVTSPPRRTTGLGLAERRLGAALRDRPRNEYVISTKVGRLLVPTPERAHEMDDEEGFRVPAAFTRRWDFSRDGILKSVESSLERLGLDRVDILYLHDPDQHWDAASTTGIDALVELREQGGDARDRGRDEPVGDAHRVRATLRRGRRDARRPVHVARPLGPRRPAARRSRSAVSALWRRGSTTRGCSPERRCPTTRSTSTVRPRATSAREPASARRSASGTGTLQFQLRAHAGNRRRRGRTGALPA